MSSNGSAGTDHDSVMRHYFYNAPDGSVHVESALNGERWQHHVHTVPEFSLWSELVSEDSLVAMGPASCTCDLAPGVEFTPPYSDQPTTFRGFVRNRDGNHYGVEFITENDDDYRKVGELHEGLSAMNANPS
jgi:hypothetical protein